MTEAASRLIKSPPSDRQLIRVDFMPDRFGIGAALRHAFEVDAVDASDHDFERLLNDLH